MLYRIYAIIFLCRILMLIGYQVILVMMAHEYYAFSTTQIKFKKTGAETYPIANFFSQHVFQNVYANMWLCDNKLVIHMH
jgi:hypothetical protein